MRNQFKILALAAVAALGLSSTGSALNFNNGDLVLFFQNPTGTGASNTVFVNLGSAITYRGATQGPDVANMLNLVNINSTLTTAFGDWVTEVTLHMGVAGVRSASGTLGASGGTVSGDPNRTVYMGDQRNSAGTAGVAGSAGYSGYSDAGLGTASNNIIQMNLAYDALNGGNPNQAEIIDINTSLIDDWNPFLLVPTNMNTAFATFSGGVMQSQSSSAKPALIGTIGPVSNVEFALDLYRIPAVAGKTGQLAGDVAGTGTFEGTFVLDSSGNVSFVTVPEPTTAVLVGLGLGALVARRRRNA